MNLLNKILLTGMIGIASCGIIKKTDINGKMQDTEFSKEFEKTKRESDSLFNDLDKTLKRIDSLSKTTEKRLEHLDKEFRDYLKNNPEPHSKMIYSDNLKINRIDSIYYFTNNTEKKGIEEIRKINDGYEEAWLYLPEKQIWYEIGIKGDSTSTLLCSQTVKKILNENPTIKELIFYHNHPRKGEYNQPSNNDMFSSLYANLNHLNHKVTGKIITKEGIVEYSLNDKGKEILEKEKQGVLNLDSYIVYEEDINKYFNIKFTKYK